MRFNKILKLANKFKIMSSTHLPLFIEGEVVKGFGRGSKDLGCPTANYSLSVVQTLPQDFEPGVYYGWAQVNSDDIHKMVLNVGWCPFYQNKEKSVETHIMHEFDGDFYGSQLKIGIIGYLREEKNFTSLDDLIKQINQDKANAEKLLDQPDAQKFTSHSFFAARTK